MVLLHTFARAVRSPQYRALLYSAVRREQLAHIVLRLLFAEHSNEQLPICSEKTPSVLLENSTERETTISLAVVRGAADLRPRANCISPKNKIKTR